MQTNTNINNPEDNNTNSLTLYLTNLGLNNITTKLFDNDDFVNVKK
jgi:hypothetical protein